MNMNNAAIVAPCGAKATHHLSPSIYVLCCRFLGSTFLQLCLNPAVHISFYRSLFQVFFVEADTGS